MNYFNFLFNNKIINENYAPPPLFQLRLCEGFNKNEYPSIPVKSDTTDGISKKQISVYIKSIHDLKLLNNFTNCYHANNQYLDLISLKQLEGIVEFKENKRYLTPQASIIFRCIRKSFEFLFNFLDDILNSIFNVLILRTQYNPKTIKEQYWYTCLTDKLRVNGTCLIEILKTDSDFYKKLRNNYGLIDLYDISIGAALLLIGSTMARRQGEILDLDTNLCLYPPNLDPLSNTDHSFYLRFNNRKSGISLYNLETREPLDKPIIRSVAGIIYKFQSFNKKLKDHGLIPQKNNSLFNFINNTSLKLHKLDTQNYYDFSDKFCDYIETPTVLYRNNTLYRYYLKQHQLRRFFALMFFWSNAYDGLDTLRNFLGHTDTEHLYYYITTELSGAVLSSVKAQYLTESIIYSFSQARESIKNLESLLNILKDSFKVNSFEILSMNDFQKFYGNFSGNIKIQQELENEIFHLLDSDQIDLFPEFFTVKNQSGIYQRDFYLIIKVKDDIL